MAYEPAIPRIIRGPERIADETWLIHQVQEALGAPLRVYLNSMVIRGAEPVIVDTGTVANRARWLDDVFGLVDPADVRYVFISHDDVDHTGNLAQVMEHCPNATLLASWALVERFSNAFEFPLPRCRWVDDGSHLDLDDRRLHFVRPPLWDAPTTRGVFDTSTDVYWAVDAFATPCSTAVEASVDELDPEAWRGGVAMFAHHALSPWLTLVDNGRYRHHVEGVRALGATTIASAHSPLITGASVDTAFDLLVDLPNVEVPPAPDQAVLDAIVSQLPRPEPDMRIGIGLPQLGRFADIDTLRRVAIAAEASGVSSLWAIDRLLVPVNPRSAYPASADRSDPCTRLLSAG